MIKKIAIGVGVVLLLLVVAVAAIPFLVPTEAVTSRVTAMVRDATGRELRIEGPVEIAVFPAIAVRMSDVALANVEGSSEPDMVSLGELDVRVALLPLLGGEVEIDRFVLRQPSIVLEVAEDGTPNWQFGGPEEGAAQEGAAQEQETAPAEDAGQEGGSPLEALTLGDIQIVDGTVTYIDHRTGETTVLSDVSVTAALGDLSGPVSVTGDAVFRDVAIALDLSADDAAALIDGSLTPVSLSLESEPLTLSFDGTASGGAAPGGSGDLTLDVPSLADLASWLRQPLPAGAPAGALNLAGEVEATPARVAVEGLTIEVEDMSAEGDLAVGLAGERPLVTGALTVTQLDLDHFMGDDAAGEEGAEDAPAGEEPAEEAPPPAASGDAPVDFSALLMADGDVTLDLAGVSFGDTSIGATTVQAVLQAGNLDLTTSDAAMFGGTASINLSASATSQSVALAANLAQIDLAALPLPVEGVDGVSGRVTGIVQGHSEGGTVAALRENADGEAALTITDAGATYQPEGMAEPLTLTGLRAQVNADMSRVAVSDMAMTVADIPVSGTLTLGMAGARPSVSGAIDTGHIDVDRLMETFAAAPAEEGAGSGGGGGASSGDQAAEEGWSTEAIDLSALQMVDATLTLGAEGLTIQQVETGPTTISVNLINGELETRLSETAVFEGTVGGVVRASSAGETPSFSAELEMLDVQAEPLLVRLADSDRLSGRMSGNLDVTASGRSQREIVGALDGTGAILFSDGALKGVNIAAMLRNLGGAFDQANAGQAQQTDFAELGGTFQIADGLLTTNDLRMLAPLFRIEGTGQANLVTRTVDFRLEPKLVATIEGQGGEFEEGGLMVPIIVSGPFSDISYRPDLAGAVESIISDPEAVEQQLESLSEQTEQLREGLGDDPEATIRGVLQGLTGGETEPAPAPAPTDTAPAGEAAPAETAPAEPAPEQQPADPAQQLLEGIFGN
ncbi:AsmA family protein [Inquilinus sp. CAU 1745]|uniref:AsmA family protein n=1 Tax=Inquilinus sp. CAU 1745 TaxID=3140369 RepID=UPI00325B6EFE